MHPVYEKLKLALGLQYISILVPRIWFHVPHPSNGQKMSKTKPFRRQKRRFLDGARLQEFWLRRAGPPTWIIFMAYTASGPATILLLKPGWVAVCFLDSIRILGSSANFSDSFWAKNMNAATSFTSKNGTNILIFETSKNKEPIYLFCADFY